MKDIDIEIVVRDSDNKVIARRHAFTFEGAYENLGKLERYILLHEKYGVDSGTETK